MYAAPSAGGLFGSSTPAPSIFGAPVASPAAPFGSTPSSTPFGAPAPSAFNAPAPSTFGAFGSPAPAAPATVGFGAQQQQQAVGTAAVPYQKTNKQDGTNQIVLQAITAMPQYEQKSFEELRVEDYLAGNKGTKGQAAPAGTGFGFGAPQPGRKLNAAQIILHISHLLHTFYNYQPMFFSFLIDKTV